MIIFNTHITIFPLSAVHTAIELACNQRGYCPTVASSAHKWSPHSRGVCMFVCLFVYMLVCRTGCLSVCLPVCWSVCMFCLYICWYLYVCMSLCLTAYLSVSLFLCLSNVYMSVCLCVPGMFVCPCSTPCSVCCLLAGWPAIRRHGQHLLSAASWVPQVRALRGQCSAQVRKYIIFFLLGPQFSCISCFVMNIICRCQRNRYHDYSSD